jgi:hypothetical protein
MLVQMSILRKLNNDSDQLNFMSLQLNSDEKYFHTNQINKPFLGFEDFCCQVFDNQIQQNTEKSQLVFLLIENLENEIIFLYELGKFPTKFPTAQEVFLSFKYQNYIDFCKRELNFNHWHNYAKELIGAYENRQIAIPDLNNFTGFDE